MWRLEIRHPGLSKFRVIKGETQAIVNLRAEMQMRVWNEQWTRTQAVEANRQKHQNLIFAKESKKQSATEQSQEAQQALDNLETLLKVSLETDHTIDWSRLKDTSHYPVPRPTNPESQTPPPEPRRDDQRFNPKLSWISALMPGSRDKARARADAAFSDEHDRWTSVKNECDRLNQVRGDQFKKDFDLWKTVRAKWLENQANRNAMVDKARQEYFEGKSESITEYCEMVLQNSKYPDGFPSDASVEYLPATRTLVVDYSLPDISVLPNLKAVKYIATRDVTKINDDGSISGSADAFQKVTVSEAWLNRTYDSVLYQIALRSLHELFSADEINALESIVFNGWVTSVDKGTGKQVTGCILSMQALKSEFMEINLAQVDPKACFKKLKGVSAAKLTALQPIRPILQLNKEDKRFISAYEVAEGLDTSSNLAAMDWEDFEQLIRELFEKEFSANGGEVKITRASRDGGVDAVVFDPDPIRGGKIVVQAKRYTHTVGVSAVRDLYGTIHNEGANKGILVTTADYGSDSYEFAKGKPITLLSGSELLYLLEKHGHKARIDLQEARLLYAEKEKARTAGGSA